MLGNIKLLICFYIVITGFCGLMYAGVQLSGKEQGFLLAGRSLREVEKREEKLEFFVGAVWVLALSSVTAVTFIFSVLEKMYKKKSR